MGIRVFNEDCQRIDCKGYQVKTQNNKSAVLLVFFIFSASCLHDFVKAGMFMAVFVLILWFLTLKGSDLEHVLDQEVNFEVPFLATIFCLRWLQMNEHDCKDIGCRHEDGRRPVVCEGLRQERESIAVDESWEGSKQEHDLGEEREVPPVAVPVAEAEKGEQQEAPEEGHTEAQLDTQLRLDWQGHTPYNEHYEGQEDDRAQPEGGVERDLSS